MNVKQLVRTVIKQGWALVSREHPYEAVLRWSDRLHVGELLVASMSKARIDAEYAELLAGLEPERVDTASPVGLQALRRRELMRRYYRTDAAGQERLNRSHLWGGEAGLRWHEQTRRYFADPARGAEYMRHRTALVTALSALLAAQPDRYRSLVEIGTGNGLFLAHLARTLHGPSRYTGVDLNASQIERNRVAFLEEPLEFQVDLDAAFVAADGGVVVVAVGTLECFPQLELERLFARLAQLGRPVALALAEPVNMDLEHEHDSTPRDATLFSHNYPLLLERAGFLVRHKQIDAIRPDVPNWSNVTVVATAG